MRGGDVQRASRQRQAGLDVCRCLAALAVVFIHCPLPGDAGMYVLALTRYAVPYFFLTSGFFYQDVIERRGELRQLKKMIRLLMSGCGLYVLYGLIQAVAQGHGLAAFVHNLVAPSRIAYFLALNDTVAMGDHLWFLAAMAYILAGAMVLSRLDLLRLWPVTCPLLMGQLLLGRYSELLLGMDIHNRWSRNFFFLGLPFFWLGYTLRQKDAALERWFECKEHKGMAVVVTFALVGMSMAECAYSLNGPVPDSSGDLFVSSIPFALLVFLLARYGFPAEWEKVPMVSCLRQIGRSHSMVIYIFHPIALSLVEAVVGLHWYTPVLAFAVSLLVSVLLNIGRKAQACR